MEKLDRIKAVIAFCIVGSVIAAFAILGQNSPVTRWLAAGGIIVWLITMYLINLMKRRGQ